MKKYFVLFCFLTVCHGAFAQKNYITVIARYLYRETQTINLTGDLPSDIKAGYNATIGNVLNLLSERGYEVEHMTAESGGNALCFLLSKKTSSNPSAVRQIVTGEEETIEIARYNLQGIPVNENEKGVQIIVYSNYTTKTVIVQ